jgi:hypothetical protein
MPVKISAVVKTVAVVGLLLWAGRTVPYWGSWASSLFKKNPAQMCSASEIVDRLTTEIRDVTTNLEKIYSAKSAPSAGSNGSYAPPRDTSEPNVTVIVDGVSAVDYNSDVDRVKCVMTYQVNGAERANTMAALQGQGAQRSLAYFVQPDANGRLIVSW